MNMEIGTEAAQFPEKEYINGIIVAVQPRRYPPFNFFMDEGRRGGGWEGGGGRRGGGGGRRGGGKGEGGRR
jgi:hypothetical protein